MGDSFVSRKDRIIASAIDIISELGLSALTTKNLALKENMSEGLLYKYFGGIDEVLVEVVNFYSKYDESVRHTVSSKSKKNMDKLYEYADTYATYYDNYYAISTLMLQYEELLHNVGTREQIAKCIEERRNYVKDLFNNAIREGEIIDDFSTDELADVFQGIIMSKILSRRIMNRKISFKNELMSHMRKWIDSIKIEEREEKI